jgi:hypothetical protein
MAVLLQNNFTLRGILSAILGACLALATFYLIIVSPTIILSIGWIFLVLAIITLATSIATYIYIQQTDDFHRIYWLDGLRYLTWFVGNSLLWIAVCILFSAMLLRFVGASFWILALCAGGFAVSVYTLQGIFFLRKVIWYRLCWTIPNVTEQVADNPDSAILLSQRYTLAIENNTEEVDYIGLIRLALRTPSAKIVEFDKLARKQIHLLYFPSESWMRVRALFPVFVMTTFLSLILFGVGWGLLQATADPVRHYLEPLIIAQQADETTENSLESTATSIATATAENNSSATPPANQEDTEQSDNPSQSDTSTEGEEQSPSEGDSQGEGNNDSQSEDSGQGEGESDSQTNSEGDSDGQGNSQSASDEQGNGDSQAESNGQGEGSSQSQNSGQGEGDSPESDRQNDGDSQSENSDQGEDDSQSDSDSQSEGEEQANSEDGDGQGEGSSQSQNGGQGEGDSPESDRQNDGDSQSENSDQGEGDSQSDSDSQSEGDSQAESNGQGEADSQSENSGQGEGEQQADSNGQGAGESQSGGSGQGEGQSQSEGEGQAQEGSNGQDGSGSGESESGNPSTFGLGESTPMMSDTVQPIPTPVASGINPADRINVDVPPMRDPSRDPSEPRDIDEDEESTLESAETADNIDASQELNPNQSNEQPSYQRIPNWILELTTKE